MMHKFITLILALITTCGSYTRDNIGVYCCVLRPLATGEATHGDKRLKQGYARATAVIIAEEIHGTSVSNIVSYYTFGYNVLLHLPIDISYTLLNNEGVESNETYKFNILGMLSGLLLRTPGGKVAIYARSHDVSDEILSEVVEHIAYILSTYYEEPRGSVPQNVRQQLSYKTSAFHTRLRTMGLDIRKYDYCDSSLQIKTSLHEETLFYNQI